MRIEALEIPELKLIVVKRFADTRGNFQEVWSDRVFRENVADVTFVQDNQSFSIKKGTLRGLHFQRPPRAQGKLVHVLHGAILDVAVDIRYGSPTYGRHSTIRLDAKEGGQLWIPGGFLHGFCPLEDQTVVFYKVTDYYSPEHEAGVIWNDPVLGIDWLMDNIVLSEKDQTFPGFSLRHLTTLACLAVVVAVRAAVSSRVSKTDQYAQVSRARTNEITEMDHWISDPVPADSFLVLSYYALDSDGFLKWIEQSGVGIPQQMKHRDVEIWWLKRQTLDGKKGYVCVSKADIAFSGMTQNAKSRVNLQSFRRQKISRVGEIR